MFRITQTDYPKRTMLVVEGELSGDDLGIIEKACLEALSKHNRVVVLLKEITRIDERGKVFLKRLATTGVRMRALGIYSRFLLRRLMCELDLPCVG